MKNVLVLLLAGLMAGCSGTGDIRAQVAGANIEIARSNAIAAAKPILDAEIPTPNGVMRIIVHAPQGSGNNGQVTVPEDPAWRVAGQAVGVLGTAAGLYLGGTAAVGLVQAASGGIVKALQTAPDPVIVQPAETVVVTQPRPVIVPQPTPIVIEPFIVDPVIVEPVVVNPVIVQQP